MLGQQILPKNRIGKREERISALRSIRYPVPNRWTADFTSLSRADAPVCGMKAAAKRTKLTYRQSTRCTLWNRERVRSGKNNR